MLLAIDTALDACTVALLDNRVTAQMLHEPMGRGHADRLVPMIQELLARADHPAVESILVTVGPGSFTGLRVGIAAARALGLAWNVPVLGVSTMATLAAAARHVHDGAVMVVHDAKRAHVYMQCFQNGVATSDISVATPADASALATLQKTVVVGTGAALLHAVNTLHISPFPMPERMAQCAEQQPLSLTPLYIRPPDAVPSSAGAGVA